MTVSPLNFLDEDAYFAAVREVEDEQFAAPYSFYAEADREAHYLFVEGFTSSCSCSRCEAEAEAASYAAEYEFHFDFVATAAEVDAEAGYRFADAEAARAREFAPLDDPWMVAGAPFGEPPF